MPIQIVYTDLNSKVGQAGPPLLHDQLAVLNAVRNILDTELGEREFRPEFGSILTSYLQDPIDDDTEVKIRYNLIVAIERWEPRVIINQRLSYVVADRSLPGYRVQLAMTIRGLEHLETILGFYIKTQGLN